MAFVFVSELPPSLECGNVSSFQSDVDTIKKYLTEIGNTYLLVAYRVYEMSWSQNYKPWYKNITDACYSTLGFKKSTTYNLINIVKRFGTPERDGYIPYSSLFGASKFSYSQLTQMLSLSDKQIEQVTPEMSVREIKSLKADSKRLEKTDEIDSDNNFDDDSDTFIDNDSKRLENSDEIDFDNITIVDSVILTDDQLFYCPRCGSSCRSDINSACETYIVCTSCKLRSPSFFGRGKAFTFWNTQEYAGTVPELQDELNNAYKKINNLVDLRNQLNKEVFDLKKQLRDIESKLDCLY